MNKYLAIASVMLVSGTAEAHSHPGLDALSHAIEHSAIHSQAWLPYALFLGFAGLLGAIFQIKRHRRAENHRSEK